MNLPFFFIEDDKIENEVISLGENSSRHIVQVLRMKTGEHLQLTNGKGTLLTVELTNAHKKLCQGRILSTVDFQPPFKKNSIAISLIKNTSRFEWFLEKATELGINEIIPIICERTEKQHFRSERMKNILVSAMLQSQQAWLPLLHEPLSFNDCIRQFNPTQKLIAHCIDAGRRPIKEVVDQKADTLILIGPEGDFTESEIELAIQYQFTPVVLGETRLRTETAGLAAAVILSI